MLTQAWDQHLLRKFSQCVAKIPWRADDFISGHGRWLADRGFFPGCRRHSLLEWSNPGRKGLVMTPEDWSWRRVTSDQRQGRTMLAADDKDNARLIVSQIVLDTLNELKMAYPKTTPKRRRELKAIRKLLAK